MNKNENLFRIIGEIDDDLIIEADNSDKNIIIFPSEKAVKKNNWKKIALTAACFLICAGVFLKVNSLFDLKTTESVTQNTTVTIAKPSAPSSALEKSEETVDIEVEEEIDEAPAESPAATEKTPVEEEIIEENLEVKDEKTSEEGLSENTEVDTNPTTGGGYEFSEEIIVETEEISENPKTDANPTTGGSDEGNPQTGGGSDEVISENPEKYNPTLGSNEDENENFFNENDEKIAEFYASSRLGNLPLRAKDENGNTDKDFYVDIVDDNSVYTNENGENFICIQKHKITNLSNSEKTATVNLAYAIEKGCDAKLIVLVNDKEVQMQGKIVSEEEILDTIGQSYTDDEIEYILYDFSITIGTEPVTVSLAYLDK